jgi:hypothetical protein
MLMQTQRKGGSTARTHSQPDTKMKWVVSITLRPLYPWKELVTLHKKPDGFQGRYGWPKILVFTGIWVSDRPARRSIVYAIPAT